MTDHTTPGSSEPGTPRPKPRARARKESAPVMSKEEWIAKHLKNAPEKSEEFMREIARIYRLDVYTTTPEPGAAEAGTPDNRDTEPDENTGKQ